MHNEHRHGLHYSLNPIRIIKSGGDEMGGRIERKGRKNTYGILVEKPKGKSQV
jgi:hypothetical protein